MTDIFSKNFWELISRILEPIIIAAVDAAFKKYLSQTQRPIQSPIGKLLSFRDVQRKLNISDPTLRKLLQMGQLEGFQVGNQWRITESAMAAFMRKIRPDQEL